ncbi:hypothetical protein DUI87_22853 [Hirundo rustica rustica]|uniref:Uncharacterized protein n=1 Tax=Hirundo rustica rustica TaxID=333673 RepID=A0A3M0JGI4_HIRRU|nr:hypothetical protein DUI87_22853 [Hirundo rustica rustica]
MRDVLRIVTQCIKLEKEFSTKSGKHAIAGNITVSVRIKHNTKLAAKIFCDSPDCSGRVMRNYRTEQQKSNDYIQKKEAEKFCFGHRSLKAQHKCKKSSQAWTNPEEQRLSGGRTEIAQ